MPLYQYHALTRPNEIRILNIQPGTYGSPLLCRLEHARLDQRPDYEALSYAWGPNPPSQRITIDDTSHAIVTTTLYNALQSLRHPRREKQLWADALCVNQNDIAEKDKQIALFGQIYTQASMVVSYIGEKDENTDAACALLDQLLEYARRHKDNPRRPDMLMAMERNTLHTLGFPNERDPAWKGLHSLLRREWSSRTWIVQESLLNEKMTMYCGQRNISWNKLPNLIHFSKTPNLLHPMAMSTENEFDVLNNSGYSDVSGGMNRQVNLAALNHLRRDILMFNKKKTLLDLLEWCMRFECGQLQDKVFSLQAVASDWQQLNLGPYVTDARSTFIKAAVRIMTVHRSLDILSNVKPKKEMNNLPSWVPDWTPVTGRPLVGFLWDIKYTERNPYSASGPTNATVSPSWNLESITFEGKGLDTIKWRSETVTEIPDNEDGSLPWNNIISNWYLKMFNGGMYGNSRLVNNAFWRILIANITHERKSARANYEDYFIQWCNLLDFQITRNWPPQCEPDVTRAMQYQAAFVSALLGRRFIVTDSGFAGVVPGNALRGDEICILKGGRTPYVIRERDGRYTFVGEAYIHGLMGGEGVNMSNAGWTPLTFY